jgi:signal transduction histidine kinase
MTLVFGLLFAAVEITEDELLPNLHFILVPLFGIVIPLIAWSLLTIVVNNLARRLESETRLDLHRRFTGQIEKSQDLEELVKFIVQVPSAFLPVEHVSLFVYDHLAAQVIFMTEWNAHLTQPSIDAYQALSSICATCLMTRSAQLRVGTTCLASPQLHADDLKSGYCQPLKYDSLLVGILRLKLRPGAKIDATRARFLNEISAEAAVALALSIARPRQMIRIRDEAQIDERRSLAHDLHTSLAQQASYLHLNLERLLHEERLIAADEVRAELRQMRDVAHEIYDQIRSDLAHLYLGQTTDLVAAVERYARLVAHRAHLAISVANQGEPVSLPPVLNYQLFSLLREGLNNVEKHAFARRVRVTLNWLPDHLSIDVVDDGVGFNSVTSGVDHYGLIMMNERAQDLGGRIKIDSTPGKGTRLNFNIPVSRRDAESAPAVAFEPSASVWPMQVMSPEILVAAED